MKSRRPSLTQAEYARRYRARHGNRAQENGERYRARVQQRLTEDPAFREEWQAKQRRKERRRRLKTYGLSLTLYQELLNDQGGACAICGGTQPGGKGLFHVDHDHKSGHIRGLLCHWCNAGLGSFSDNAQRLRQAIAYLEAKLAKRAIIMPGKRARQETLPGLG